MDGYGNAKEEMVARASQARKIRIWERLSSTPIAVNATKTILPIMRKSLQNSMRNFNFTVSG